MKTFETGCKRDKALLEQLVQTPLSSTNWSANINKKVLLSKHNRKIFISLCLLFIIFFIALVLLTQPSGWEAIIKGQAESAILVALITGAATFALRLYDKASVRVGIADTLASDILSLGRVIAAGDLIGQFSRLGHAQAINDPASRSKGGFADEAGEEEYFKVFDSSLLDLRGFAPSVVLEITAFYTILRGSRDATRGMVNWPSGIDDTSINKRRAVIANILYLMLVWAEHGRRSLEALLEDGPMVDYGVGLFRMLELQAMEAIHLFETEAGFKITDIRHGLIERRRDELAPLLEKAIELGMFKQLYPADNSGSNPTKIS